MSIVSVVVMHLNSLFISCGYRENINGSNQSVHAQKIGKIDALGLEESFRVIIGSFLTLWLLDFFMFLNIFRFVSKEAPEMRLKSPKRPRKLHLFLNQKASLSVPKFGLLRLLFLS